MWWVAVEGLTGFEYQRFESRELAEHEYNRLLEHGRKPWLFNA